MKKIIFSFAVLVGILGMGSAVFAQSAVLFFNPASSTVAPGQTFRITVWVDTKGEQVNAVAAYFTYPQDKLDVVRIDTASSVMTLIAEPRPTDSLPTNGKIDIVGGTPSPGFSGVQNIASVDFRVKQGATGTATFKFTSDAEVYSNTTNQDILNPGSPSATYTIQVPPPTPPPPPEEPPPPPEEPSPKSPSSNQQPSSFTPPALAPRENPLLISNVKAEAGGAGMLISWETNRPASSQVYYGTGDTYEFSVRDEEYTRTHEVVLEKVTLAGGYALEVAGEDEAGAQARSERFWLSNLIPKNTSLPPPPDEGFQLKFSSVLLFVVLPGFGVALVGFVLVRRMRFRIEGG